MQNLGIKSPKVNKTDGGGPKKLSENFGISMQKAKEVILQYFTTFFGLSLYFETEGKKAKKQGYIEVNPVTKRRAGLPRWETYEWCRKHIEYFSARGWEVRPEIEEFFRYYDSKYQRLSQNYRIQATAADISKVTGILLRKYSRKIGFNILLLIHDEWVLETPEFLGKTTSYILEKCCREAVEKFVKIPIPADSGIHKYWSK